jgi:hypothetical protein
MRHDSLEMEAEACRALAKKFAGLPEEPFLFKLANALDEVAAMEAQHSGPTADEPTNNQNPAIIGPRWLRHRPR